jgi:hypothetical protein
VKEISVLLCIVVAWLVKLNDLQGYDGPRCGSNQAIFQTPTCSLGRSIHLTVHTDSEERTLIPNDLFQAPSHHQACSKLKCPTIKVPGDGSIGQRETTKRHTCPLEIPVLPQLINLNLAGSNIFVSDMDTHN